MILKKKISINFGFLLIASAIASDLRRILPLNLKIREGQDLQLRLTKVLPDTVSCYVKTPSLTSYNLLSEEPDRQGRIIYWTENGECGVIARNVTKADAGMWRITAKNSTYTLVDTSFVEILDKVGTLQRHLSIQNGLGYTLTLEEDSKYCWIHQPHTEEIPLVGGECKVELNEPTAAVDGTWSATAGVIGQLEEVPVKAELSVFRDRLVTGYKTDIMNTISIYCNLRDSDWGLEFCRFEKPDGTKTGFQLSEGLRHGRYGYFGAGLENGECGITITAPTTADYGQWLCSIGIKDEAPFGSYVWINSYNSRHPAAIRAEVLSTNTATTVLNEVLRLKCEVSVPISYCWFRAPDGEILAPSQTETRTDALYKYFGNGIGKGQCGVEITTAETKHEGKWTCHMGPVPSGLELTSTINVRISETPLAAKEQHITVKNGGTLTLECRTVPNSIAITYCRFLMPDGIGIHIDQDVTENNPLILDNAHYWFSGAELKFGGCGLKVNRISSRHFGNWTCAARLESSKQNMEVFDTIVVAQGEQTTAANLTAAATTGTISGVLVLVGILAAGSMYIVKRIRARGFQDNISNNFSGTDRMSMSAASESSASTNSDISLQEMAARR